MEPSQDNEKELKPYPLFRRENMPAYVTVMDTWAAVFVVWAIALVAVSDSVRFGVALVWAAAATMSGMTIMFVASLLNLRKLSPGFRRLAEGEDDPSMPPSGAPYSPPSGQPAVPGLKGRVRTHRWPMSLGQQHDLAMVLVVGRAKWAFA